MGLGEQVIVIRMALYLRNPRSRDPPRRSFAGSFHRLLHCGEGMKRIAPGRAETCRTELALASPSAEPG